MDAVAVMDVLVGVVGVGMAFSVLLQLRRCVQTRSSRDVSTGMLWVLAFGSCCWTVYGVVHGLPTVVASNVAGVACDLATLTVAYRYRRAERTAAAVGRPDGDLAVATA